MLVYIPNAGFTNEVELPLVEGRQRRLATVGFKAGTTIDHRGNGARDLGFEDSKSMRFLYKWVFPEVTENGL